MQDLELVSVLLLLTCLQIVLTKTVERHFSDRWPEYKKSVSSPEATELALFKVMFKICYLAIDRKPNCFDSDLIFFIVKDFCRRQKTGSLPRGA